MRISKSKQLAVLAALMIIPVFATPILAQEAEEEAPPEPNWVNSLGLSYVGTSGNTDTSSLGLDFKSTRKPTPWGLEFTAMFTRAENEGVVTAEQYYVGGRANRELAKRWSVFGGLAWARDPFTGFENRYLVEAGVTYLAVKSEKNMLSFDAGLSWNSEDQIYFDDVAMEEFTETVDWFGGVLGLTWEWSFSKSASLSQRLLFQPNFDDTDDWRVASDTAVTASLTKLLALQFSYLVRHRNLPIGDNEKTDTTTKMSVVLNF